MKEINYVVQNSEFRIQNSEFRIENLEFRGITAFGIKKQTTLFYVDQDFGNRIN
jgi:hypothetical protein